MKQEDIRKENERLTGLDKEAFREGYIFKALLSKGAVEYFKEEKNIPKDAQQIFDLRTIHSGEDKIKQYRARGVYLKTGRDSFLTTIWRKTREEAEKDITLYGDKSYKEGSLRVVEREA